MTELDVKRHSAEGGLPDFLLKAGAALANGEDYFRDVLDALPVAVYTTDAAGRITYFNDAAATLWGHRPELGDSTWCGSWKLYWPDGRPMPHDQSPMALAIKQGVPIRGVEAVAERPDGVRIPFIPYPTPLFDSSGTLVSAVNMLLDISDRKRAEEYAHRLAAIVESSDDAIVSKDLDGIITSWNRGAQELFGYTAEEAVGNPVAMLIPPDRIDEEPGILDRIRHAERVAYYETVRRRKDGTLVDIGLVVSPVRDANGKVIGASKIARDITERKRAREQQRLMVEETKHRMRNTLATVQAIATRTLHASDEERQTFIARLAALARAHDLLTADNWNRAPLGDVVGRTLGPFRDKAYERFAVEGPENIWLSANHASLMTIALHELATNASKYGALSNKVGRVGLTWTLVKREDATRLRVCWRESGGPPVKPPARSGFGSFLIERVLKSEGGEARLDYDPEGLVATFNFPC